MNNIETLHTIYIACLTAGVIMLVITIILFFLFDIRHVIGNLFGFTERKEIKKLRENTAFTSQLNNKYNQKMKGKVFTDSGNLKKHQTPAEQMGLTNISNTGETPEEYRGNSQTAFENDSLATEVLNHSEYANEMALFKDNQTTVLNVREVAGQMTSPPIADLQFTITRQILLTHTDETIEIG